MESIEAELEASVQAIRFSHEVGIHHKILEVDSAQVIAKLQEHGDDGFGPIHHYIQPAKERGPITSHQVPQLAQFIRFTSVAGTSWPMVADLTFSNVQCSPDQWIESSIFLLELLDLHVGPLALQPPKLFDSTVLLQAP
nr:hypothetical protein CFP56_46891 [Quercus suber]